MDSIIVSAVNLFCHAGETEANLSSHIRMMEELSTSDIVLFPELSLTGYVKSGEWLRTHREEWERALTRLVETTESFPRLTVAAGAPIRDGEGFNIAHHIIRNGTILFTHRKTILGPSERGIYGPGKEAGILKNYRIRENLPVNLAVQLCYETHFPEMSLNQADSGADLLLAAFASPREGAKEKLARFKKYLPARAYDNTLYVACCNQIWKTENHGMSPGAALIIDPRGDILSEEASEGESVCTAAVDMATLRKMRRSPMGYFRRWANQP